MTALPASFITDNGVTMIDGLATGVLLFVIALGLSLVYLGEHYVVDTLLGALYAAVVVLVVRRVPRPVAETAPA